MIGKPSLPSASSAFRRMTPVVVSSVPAMMSPSCSRRCRVQDADHVGAVVHREVRLVVDRGLDVRVVRVVVLALDREDTRCRTPRRARPRRRPASRAGSTRTARRPPRPPSASASGSRSRSSRAGTPRCGSRRAAAPRSNRSRIAASTGICRSAHSIRRSPSRASARSFTSYRFVVAIDSFRFRRPVAARACAAPTRPRASVVGAGEPAVDGRAELGLAPEPRREDEVGDLDADRAPQLGERPELVQLAEPVEPVAGRACGAGRRGRRARGSAASAATSPCAPPPRRPSARPRREP